MPQPEWRKVKLRTAKLAAIGAIRDLAEATAQLDTYQECDQGDQHQERDIGKLLSRAMRRVGIALDEMEPLND